jgi:glycolate oxidase
MPVSKALISEFVRLLGADSVFSDEADLLSYAYDAAVLDQRAPGIVLAPSTSELLGEAVRLAYESGLPITPRGAGTSLSGAALPEPGGGAVILTTKLKRILEINGPDLYAVAEPGVVTAELAREAARRGLFYPPDPGSQEVSTLGGNVALNAGGLRGLKYGVTKDYLLGVDFFDWRGGLVRAGSKCVKSVAGYSLTGLMAASEGTLGVISQITLKLLPPPSDSRAMLASFREMAQAAEAVAAIIAEKTLPSTLEILDNKCVRVVEAASPSGLPLDAGAVLLIEADGSHPEQVRADAEKIRAVCLRCGAASLREAKGEAEREAVWRARRAVLPSLARLRPTTVLEDATVPRSKVPEMAAAVARLAKKHDLECGTFGHAGDGNLHPTILCDRRDQEEFKRVEAMVDEIFGEALALGGTLSGEHGIGEAKARWMGREAGAATVEYSKAIRRAADPRGLFNPGKKFL